MGEVWIMKLAKLNEMIGGWYIGDFDCAYRTNSFEVSYKIHLKNSSWDTHFHKYVTEINLLIRGRMTIHEKILLPGDIFILEPYEIADPIFNDDCEIICVKVPGIRMDKVTVIEK